jgi:hypothetical protein
VLLDHSDARGLPAPFGREEARARGARHGRAAASPGLAPGLQNGADLGVLLSVRKGVFWCVFYYLGYLVFWYVIVR